jgi:hypothetical protein
VQTGVHELLGDVTVYYVVVRETPSDGIVAKSDVDQGVEEGTIDGLLSADHLLNPLIAVSSTLELSFNY